MPTMDIASGAILINEIELLDAKLESLESGLNTAQARLEVNKREIARMAKLENENVEIESELVSLQKDHNETKSEIDKRIADLATGGWTIPVKKRSNGNKATKI